MRVVKSDIESKVETNRFSCATALATYLVELETDVIVVDDSAEIFLILVDRSGQIIVHDLIDGGSDIYMWWSDVASDLFDNYNHEYNYKRVEATLTYKYL